MDALRAGQLAITRIKTIFSLNKFQTQCCVAEVQIDITGVDNWYFEQFHAL